MVLLFMGCVRGIRTRFVFANPPGAKAWELIDRDSEGQPAPETETDAYREYAYLPSGKSEAIE